MNTYLNNIGSLMGGPNVTEDMLTLETSYSQTAPTETAVPTVEAPAPAIPPAENGKHGQGPGWDNEGDAGYGDRHYQLNNMVSNNARHHTGILYDLIATAPESVTAALNEAIALIESGYDAALGSLE